MKQEIKAVTENGTEVFFFAHSGKTALNYAKSFVEKYAKPVKLFWILYDNPFKNIKK